MASNRNAIPCPECGGRVRTITSRLLSDNVREIYFDCINEDCLCRFVGHLGMARMLLPRLPPAPADTPPIVERRPNDIVVPRTADSAASLASPTPNHPHVLSAH